MLSTPEYAFRKRKEVITAFRGKKIIWSAREDAKNYILENMMTAEGEDYDRYAAIYFQLLYGMYVCIDDQLS